MVRSALQRPAMVRAKYDPQKTWTQDELKILKRLYDHLGNDNRGIADQINLLFPAQHRTPKKCKEAVQRFGLQTVDKSPLTREEVIFIYNKIKSMTQNQQKHIWRDIGILFPEREVWVVQTMILFILCQISKNLVYFFADDDFKRFYFERFRSLTQLTWQIIMYLSNHKLTIVESSNPFFLRLSEACFLMEGWVDSFIQNELYSVGDFSDFLKLNADAKLPNITSQLFSETIEVILTLDTLNRVCYCLAPYESQIFWSRHNRKKRRLTHVKREDDYGTKIKDDEQDDDEIIPERQQFIPYDIARLQKNRISNPFKFQTMRRKEMNFFQLSESQKKFIQNSVELELLIPLQTALDQTIVSYKSYQCGYVNRLGNLNSQNKKNTKQNTQNSDQYIINKIQPFYNFIFLFLLNQNILNYLAWWDSRQDNISLQFNNFINI